MSRLLPGYEHLLEPERLSPKKKEIAVRLVCYENCRRRCLIVCGWRPDHARCYTACTGGCADTCL
ncbi:hypothetical protein ABT354_12470 [Streptomyces sp. NPDC000594]|uniref:hypothetical protein n=1 Tax=Streptomyces sp. NPDC000594 TaxID=3154261 RepID=UPI00332F4CA1